MEGLMYDPSSVQSDSVRTSTLLSRGLVIDKLLTLCSLWIFTVRKVFEKILSFWSPTLWIWLISKVISVKKTWDNMPDKWEMIYEASSQIGGLLFRLTKQGLLHILLLIHATLLHWAQFIKHRFKQAWLIPKPATNSTFWRPLGTTEIIKEKLHHKGMHIMSSVIFLSSKNAIQTNVLKASLMKLMQRHPLLRAQIAYDKGVAYWQEMLEIAIDLRVDGSKNWLKCFEDNCAERFNTETGPLWRLTYLPEIMSDFDDGAYGHNSVLIWSFHHALIDGHARVRLLNELVQNLTESMPNNRFVYEDTPRSKYTSLYGSLMGNHATKEIDTFTKKAPLETNHTPPAPIESYSSSNIASKYAPYLTTMPVFKQLYGFWSESDQPSLTKNAFVEHIGVVQNIEPDMERKTSIIALRLSVDETKTLLRACKMHGVTVQSAIQAAAAVSMTKFIPKNIKRNKWPFSTSLGTGKIICKASLHNSHYPETMNNTNYVSNLAFDIPCHLPLASASADRLWNLAQEYKVDLVDNKYTHFHKHQFRNAMLNKGEFTQHIDEQSMFNAGRNDVLLTFANFGHCDFLSRDTNATIKVNGLFSGIGEHISGPIFSNSIVTFNNRLCWGVVYYTNVTTRTFAEQYLRRTRQILLNACNL